jgi:hypothetical protein
LSIWNGYFCTQESILYNKSGVTLSFNGILFTWVIPRQNIQSSLRHLTDLDNFCVWVFLVRIKVCLRILPKYYSFDWYSGPKFRFFQKSRKMGIARNNFFNQF